MVLSAPKASAVDADSKSAAKKEAAPKAAPKADIPEPKVESEVGADYIPLITALKCGELEEADQITRDLLVEIGGAQTQKQGYVYFAQAKSLPMKDMQTIDRIWSTYSDGKFGYAIQKKIWNSPQVKGDFNKFVQQIGWTQGPCGGCDAICSGCPGTLKRWLPVGAKSGNEFIYDTAKAPKGHLPLTSALRGTYLLKSLLDHPAFGADGLVGRTGVQAAQSGTPRGEVIDYGPLVSSESLRFGPSPYVARKKPWDV